MIEIAGVVGEIGLENIEPAVAVVVSDAHAHSGLLVAILAVSASGHDRDVGESSVMIVAKKNAGLGVDGNINVRPAVVVEIRAYRSDGVSRTGFKNAGFLRDVGERAIAVVAIQDVRVASEAARTAHDRNPLPLA